MVSVVKPNWPAPPNVHAYTTLRMGGYSEGNYASFNLASRISDKPAAVKKNRALLKEKLHFTNAPKWLKQTHSTIVIDAATNKTTEPEGDAAFSKEPKTTCAVLTADCLPVLICDTKGTQVAAIHAGWRGLADGVIEASLDALGLAAEDTLVWLGPAIGATAFEVGDDVRQAFIKTDKNADTAFSVLSEDKWLADIYALATIRLNKRGVNAVFGGDYCTYTDPDKFYSYRRDGDTGRMASVIWMDD